MKDGALRQSYLEACERKDYEVAHGLLGEIQKQKTFPLFIPKMAQDVSLEEIDDYVDLLYPLMNVYLHHRKIDELFKCSSALIDWLHKKHSEAWTDNDYRYDCDAHHRLIFFYETQQDEKAIEAACVIIIMQGNSIQIKTQQDWRTLLMAYRRLSVSYFNQTPTDTRGFMNMVESINAIVQQLNSKTTEDLYCLIDIYHNAGLSLNVEEWLRRADHYRGELLKFLWKNFDNTKKSFVEICNLVDEIGDADNLREADPDVDAVLKQHLSFAQKHPAKQEPLVVSEEREKLIKMFLIATEKKLWENAELFLAKIATEYLGINLDFPYEAADQPDAKIAVLLGMLTHLGMSSWGDDKKALAVPFLQKATKFIVLMRHVSDELWRHSAVAAYICSLNYFDESNFLSSIKACKRSLSMFECIREKSDQDRDCIAKARDTLEKSVRATAPVEKIYSWHATKKAAKKSLNGKYVPKSVPPKPISFPPTLAQLKQSLEDACDSRDEDSAELLMQSIGELTNLDVYSPSDDATVSDETLRCFVSSFVSLAQLYYSCNSETDKEYDAYQLASKWWTYIKIKSAEDWESYVSLLHNVCKIHAERKNSEDYLSTADRIVYVYENIKSIQNERHAFLLLHVSRKAVDFCNARNDSESARKWKSKVGACRSFLVAKFKGELEHLMQVVNKQLSQKKWDDARSAIYDAHNVLDRLNKQVLNVEAAEPILIGNHAYDFGSCLHRIFQMYIRQSLLEEAYNVLGEIKWWLEKIDCLSDDAELLRIECDVYEKAFDACRKKKWKMSVALDFARKAMPEKDKTKKMEIENRKKAQADIEKAAREQKRQEELKERARLREEKRLKMAAVVNEERLKVEKAKKYEMEKSKFIGLYRKFNKLSLKEAEVFYRYRRKLSSKIMNLTKKNYVEGLAHDLARQKLILACEAVMEACDLILSCYLKSQLDDYKNLSYEEIVELSSVFMHAWNLYNKSEEWGRLVCAFRDCASEFRQLHVLRKRLPKVKASMWEVVPTATPTVATLECVPEPNKNKRKNGVRNGLHHSLGHFLCEVSRYQKNLLEHSSVKELLQHCEENFINLVGFQIYGNLQGCLLSEEALGKIADQLFKRCSMLINILSDSLDPLWRFLNVLEACRKDPVGVSHWEILKDKIDAMIPQGESASSYAHRVCELVEDRIIELELAVKEAHFIGGLLK
ncbi:MAG: hypothetical protein SFW07_00875 [Gammaproteobacteria bacterium]|nr:hypothetical protein [Gammaproteobacteria bacterium]